MDRRHGGDSNQAGTQAEDGSRGFPRIALADLSPCWFARAASIACRSSFAAFAFKSNPSGSESRYPDFLVIVLCHENNSRTGRSLPNALCSFDSVQDWHPNI